MAGIQHILLNFKDMGVFIAVLGVLILVHEWGHYIAARLVGVNVERFSLGFGKKIFSFMYKGTEFLVCLIPLGGYVKLSGDERSECTGQAGEFYSKSVWRRFFIILNGAGVNYVFAMACIMFVFFLGYHDTPAVIGGFLEGSPAKEAGLMVGDEVIKVYSDAVYGWNDLAIDILESKGDKIELTVLRGDEEYTIFVSPTINKKENFLGQVRHIRRLEISPYSNVLGEVSPDGPAAKAGLKSGDRIIKIDSNVIESWEDLRAVISKSTKDSLYITYIRNGADNIVEVFPEIKSLKDKEGNEKDVRIINVAPTSDFATYKFGVKDSIRLGFKKLMSITSMTYKSIYYMLSGLMSAKNAAGPVGIFMIVKTASELGFSHLLFIVGVISASLAIFNLLPVIPLDGGHLFLLLVEWVRGGKPIPEKIEEWIHRIGFGLIILLALFIFYNDFVNIGLIAKIKGLFVFLLGIVTGN